MAMKHSILYCPHCKKNTVFVINDKYCEGYINGEHIVYKGIQTVCTECKEEIWSPSVASYNINALCQQKTKCADYSLADN